MILNYSYCSENHINKKLSVYLDSRELKPCYFYDNRNKENGRRVKKLGICYAGIECSDIEGMRNGSTIVGDYRVCHCVAGDDMWRYLSFENYQYTERQNFRSP